MRQSRLNLRERAAKILQKVFPDWDLDDTDIVPVDGFWKRVDVYRWQVFCHSKKRYTNGDRIPVSVGCWLTLTQFVKEASKAGCHLDDGELWPGPEPVK